MSTKGHARTLRTPKRPVSPRRPKSRHGVANKPRSGNVEEEILQLVRGGIERFILKNASVEDFFKTIEAVAEKEKTYSHQLTRSVFSKIVKDAIRKRNLRRSK